MTDESDDDRTRIPARVPGPGPSPGGVTEASYHTLPTGTRLGEFEITGLIGEGGFGIVYRAFDHSLQVARAIKEYMPSALASRLDGKTVSIKSERHAETFQAGLRSFVNEARLLAHFDHPSLVKVLRFWEQNGTAYMAMPLYEGATLKQVLAARGAPPDEAWLATLLSRLLDALDVIHADHCYHRDIAPDNILMLKDDRPLLLDFGAARRVIGDMTQALTVMLKPGYAPFEQYSSDASLKQGPWTDLYALGAVMYSAITGKTPVDAVSRIMNDPLVPLAKCAAGRYSARFLSAIDGALAVKPEQRPQSVDEFRSLLGFDGNGRPSGAAPVAAPSSAARPAPAAVVDELPPTEPGKSPQKAHAIEKPAGGVPSRGQPPEAKSGRWLMPVAGALAVAAVAAIGWSLFGGRPGSGTKAGAPTPAQVAQTQTAPAPETAPTPVPGPTVASAAAPTSAPEPTPGAGPAPGPRRAPYTPEAALQQVYAARDPSQALGLTVLSPATAPNARINKDSLKLRISSTRPGYAYLLLADTDSKLSMLFPNATDSNNFINREKSLTLPGPQWEIGFGGPPGRDLFLVIVSPHKRDFSSLLDPASLRSGDIFKQFSHDRVRSAYERLTEGAPPALAGRACMNAQASCSEVYWAAQTYIQEYQE